MNIIFLPASPLRTQAPSSVLTRLCRVHTRISFLVMLNGLKPWSTIMIFGERYPFAKMRSHPRPSHFTSSRLKPNGPPFSSLIPLPFWFIFWVFPQGGFFFTHGFIAIPGPVHDGGIIRHELAFFIGRIPWLTLID